MIEYIGIYEYVCILCNIIYNIYYIYICVCWSWMPLWTSGFYDNGFNSFTELETVSYKIRTLVSKYECADSSIQSSLLLILHNFTSFQMGIHFETGNLLRAESIDFRVSDWEMRSHWIISLFLFHSKLLPLPPFYLRDTEIQEWKLIPLHAVYLSIAISIYISL